MSESYCVATIRGTSPPLNSVAVAGFGVAGTRAREVALGMLYNWTSSLLLTSYPLRPTTRPRPCRKQRRRSVPTTFSEEKGTFENNKKDTDFVTLFLAFKTAFFNV
ncbi:UNVERIFIED_CONTAM: hypothetical protein RMT77_019334 [Armadillidium vulgare]